MGVGICRPSIHSVRFILKKTVVSLRSQVHHTPHHTDCLDVDTFLRHDNVHDFVEAEMPYPKWGDEKRTFENKVNVKDKINTKERSMGEYGGDSASATIQFFLPYPALSRSPNREGGRKGGEEPSTSISTTVNPPPRLDNDDL